MGEITFLKKIEESVGNSLDRIHQRWNETTLKIGSRIPRGVTTVGGLAIGAVELGAGFQLSEFIFYHAHLPLPIRGVLTVGAILATAASETATVMTMFAMTDAREAAQEGLKG